MGAINDTQAFVSQGLAGANSDMESMRLKDQMSGALNRRQQYVAELGASLYEATKDDSMMRSGREDLYDGIAAIDQELERIQAQLDDIERQAEDTAQAAVSIACPFCHTRMEATDMFCSGCGKPMSEVQARLAAAETAGSAPVNPDGNQHAVPVCPACNSVVREGDAFCMYCGARLDSSATDPDRSVTSQPADQPAETSGTSQRLE